MRRRGSPRPGRHHGRLLGDRRRGRRARAPAVRTGASALHADGGAQLHGGAQHRSAGAPERHVRPHSGGGRIDRLRQPIGGARSGYPQRRSGPGHRTHPVRLDGQQGRRLGQRPGRVLGERRAHPRHLYVSRVVRQPAPLHRDRQARRPQEADPRRQVGTHRRGRPRRHQPHRRHRRRRRDGLGFPRAVRRHPRQHHRRALRHRPGLRSLPAAGWRPGGHRHQRRRSRHHGDRLVHQPGADAGGAVGADARVRSPSSSRPRRAWPIRST